MNKAYYQEYFELERKHWWFTARKAILYDQLRKILPENKGMLNILNIGVSTGHSSEMLSAFGKVTSLEYEQECIDFTTAKLNMEIMQGSILDLPFPDNSFDVVCAFDVIEHVDDDQKGVDEMMRVCNKNGIVFVTVPAFMFLWSKHDEVNHHFRRYTRPQLLRLFRKEGKLIFHSYFNFWLFFIIAPLRLLFRLFPSTTNKRKGSGSDFSSPVDKNLFIERLLFSVFKSESALLSAHISLPFGISLMASWKKV